MSDREAFKAEIKRLALNAGFSLKQQPDGTMDLNPYVYAFADSVVRHTQAQAGERKCSECGNGEPDLSLYCVRCLNNDHWHLIDPDQAGDGEAVGWLVMIDGDYKFFESYDDALDARKHEEYWNKGIEHAAPRPVYTAPPAAVNQQLLDKETLCALFNHYHALAYNPKSEHYRAEHFYKAAIAAAQEQK